MFGLFGSKPKLKLQEGMEVELEFTFPNGLRSYFTKVLQTSKGKARFTIPKEGNKPLPIKMDDKIKMIALVDDSIFDANIKVTSSEMAEFQALISKNVSRHDTLLKKFEKKKPVELEVSVPIEFRAITTSHMQRAETSRIVKEEVSMITNLPIPPSTPLKLTFRIPESPSVDCEGTVTKSDPLDDEDSKKSKTTIEFSDKVKESNVFENVTRYAVHYLYREKRRKELEEQQKEKGKEKEEGS